MNIRSSRFIGFTLVELLVVIAIVGLLTALLFPVFAKVRAKARQTTCASNMRQLGQAFTLYAQDYDQRLPDQWSGRVKDDLNATVISSAWETYLRPYTRNVEIKSLPRRYAFGSSQIAEYQHHPVQFVFHALQCSRQVAVRNACFRHDRSAR